MPWRHRWPIISTFPRRPPPAELQWEEVAVAVTESGSKTLLALTSAAVALPGMAPVARADSPPEVTTLGYRYSLYREDDIEPGKLAAGVGERYEIDVHQLRLTTGLGDTWGLTVDYQHESLSGASPFGTSRGVDGNPQVVMTGASIEELRRDLNIGLRRYYDYSNAGISLGYSAEDDYTAYNLGADYQFSTEDRLNTFGLGVSISDDTLEPTQQSGFNRIKKDDKQSLTAVVNYTRVLSTVAQVQTALSLSRHSGFLSDPYKAVDVRPDERIAWAWTTQYRRYLKDWDAALHVDYRLYTDDWGIVSNTFDLAWYQNVDAGLRVAPSLRYYTQSQADFYFPTDNTTRQGYQSSDHRLSPFGALTTGIRVEAHAVNWKVVIAAERYIADGDLALGSVEVEHPALLGFSLVTLGMDYSF
ncbi:MAG: DUF3570 domain-containing protein [Gammaproteobacteria bacterium]|nr:MAG: DUF3570 domain-containing protein [Gammaproteobacteria bacterium]